MYGDFMLFDEAGKLEKGERIYLGDLKGKNEGWLRDTLFENHKMDWFRSISKATAKFKSGQRDGGGAEPQKKTPIEIGASRYCWQLALNTDPPVTKRVWGLVGPAAALNDIWEKRKFWQGR
jgi:hypothetical protein